VRREWGVARGGQGSNELVDALCRIAELAEAASGVQLRQRHLRLYGRVRATTNSDPDRMPGRLELDEVLDVVHTLR
jgi:hypothetical protein